MTKMNIVAANGRTVELNPDAIYEGVKKELLPYRVEVMKALVKYTQMQERVDEGISTSLFGPYESAAEAAIQSLVGYTKALEAQLDNYASGEAFQSHADFVTLFNQQQ